MPNFQIETMTFEEFFRKKKIDLAALAKADPSLFSEFRTHYENMGEKSFDHTKKYWFNKLRLQYHLAPEVKEEKVAIANPLVQQTIAEVLAETPAGPAASVGFKPRFKPGITKPVENPEAQKKETPTSVTAKPAEAPAPTATVGFKPRFKAGVTKPATPVEEAKDEPSASEPPNENTTEISPTKPAYKPKFNMKNIKPKEGE